MKLIFKKYLVNQEVDFIEDEIKKIDAQLTIFVRIEEDIDELFAPLTYHLNVINLNSQTGDEMDNQRLSEAIVFVDNKFNNNI